MALLFAWRPGSSHLAFGVFDIHDMHRVLYSHKHSDATNKAAWPSPNHARPCDPSTALVYMLHDAANGSTARFVCNHWSEPSLATEIEATDRAFRITAVGGSPNPYL